MKWAITPNGVGNTVGIRAAKDDAVLEAGETFFLPEETFTSREQQHSAVLAADEVSVP